MVTGIFYWLKADAGWITSLPAILVSQYLISIHWQDAKFGTIANIALLIIALTGFANWKFKNTYLIKRKEGFDLKSTPVDLLTQQDLLPLPLIIRKYIEYTGAIGKPKINNLEARFKAHIRSYHAKEWIILNVIQNNFIDPSRRLFYMSGTMKHLPVAGLHLYKDGKAKMDIRLFSAYKVQYQDGPEMDTAETVTIFNDMCCLAPASLIDPRIQWGETNDQSIKASFTNQGITIHAILYFNNEGRLINFKSKDRYARQEDGSMKLMTWSTPLANYMDYHGYRLAQNGKAMYTYPDGDFCYGEFELTEINYNLSK